MQSLEKRLQTQLLWVAALHEEHAPHRHVHIIAAIPRKLTIKDFARLRFEATRQSLEQRRALDLSAGRQELGQELQTRQRSTTYQPLRYSQPGRLSRPISRGARPAYMHTCMCPRCGAMQIEYGRNRVHQCTCGFIVHRRREPSLPRKGREWER